MTLPGLVAAKNLLDVENKERAWDNLGSSIFAEIPIPAPSLDLNFAKNKTLVDDVSGNNLITFSRGSSGTFVGSDGLIQTAASGVPRFDHNPVTGESLGLLIEEARTNIWTDSDNPTFTAVNGSITSTTELSPAGTATASKFVPVAASNSTGRYIVIPRLNTLSLTETVSFFIKTDYSYLVFCSNGQDGQINVSVNVGINLITNAVYQTTTANGTYFSTTVTVFPAGWKRISITYSSGGTLGGKRPGIIVSDTQFTIVANPGRAADQTASYVTDGTKSLTIWGVQCEAGAFPTSYIPTVASTVTRAADVAQITGANFSSWYNPEQGTILAKLQNVNQAGANAIWSFDNGGSSQRMIFRIAVGAVVTNFSTIADTISPYTATHAFAITTGSLSGAKNGILYTASTGTAVPIVTQLQFGTSPGLTRASGAIARFAYWPVRLPDLALQHVTSNSGSPSSTTYPYTFTVKGKDTLALNGVRNASTRDFVFIKGLSSPAQPRLTTAAQQVASGTVFQSAAMLKASPTTSGNYLFSSGLTLSGVSTRINNTPALSIATSPFSGSTATVSILLRELQPQANWRITEPMPSGTLASPEFAIPFETSDFVLFMKAGQN
jgi:hypothetical protein